MLRYNLRHLDETIVSGSESSIPLKVASGGSKYLLHKILVLQGLRGRRSTASCKTRSLVQCSGKKPWKQKGTGRARAGSYNSPLWRGGGVVFGPRSKIYKRKINFKERRLALHTALYHNRHKLFVVQNFSSTLCRTTELSHRLARPMQSSTRNAVLLVVDHVSNSLKLSTRNIPNLRLVQPHRISIRDVLVATTIIITDKALQSINITTHTYHGFTEVS
uniref:Large ribosomal subunit protein uL4c n=1 Tax=Cryptomonas sp. CCAC 1634B TaxID=2051848 RepID=A0A679CBN8_9CRYP|nr:ribosomal protein L4 [Cryptomonas sp. CCAC 1634B]